jgi:hypothetical protein
MLEATQTAPTFHPFMSRVPLPGSSTPGMTAPATHRLSPYHGSPATYLVYGYGSGFQAPLQSNGKLVTVHYGSGLGPITTHQLMAAHDGSGLYFVMDRAAVSSPLRVNGEFVKVAKPSGGLSGLDADSSTCFTGSMWRNGEFITKAAIVGVVTGALGFFLGRRR